MQMTGASASIRFTGWQVMRDAAAAGRQMLINAAIDKHGASANTTTNSGYVIDGENRWPYGELVEHAASLDVPEHYTHRAHSERKFIGKPCLVTIYPAQYSVKKNTVSTVMLKACATQQLYTVVCLEPM
jgi:hypothetical protein